MWMKPGSFWTQPAGESHITSAQGEEVIAYVEIDNGPYLVKPVDEAFDKGERPVNIDASNIVWLNSERTNWIASGSSAEISFLWDDEENAGMKGLFVKLPARFDGHIKSDGKILSSVLIQGKLNYRLPQTSEVKALDPGSHFSSTGNAIHKVTNISSGEAIVYIRTTGDIEVMK